jgi:hypothetical protein
MTAHRTTRATNTAPIAGTPEFRMAITPTFWSADTCTAHAAITVTTTAKWTLSKHRLKRRARQHVAIHRFLQTKFRAVARIA